MSVPAFGAVMRQLDYPMYIVTTTDGARRAGCLLGFAAQCSISPPRFMVWLSKKNHTFQVASRATRLGVHRLTEDCGDLAVLFGAHSGFGTDKFARCAWRPGHGGVPLLQACADWFVGEILSRHDTGDHVGALLRPVTAASGTSAGGQIGFRAVRDLEPGNPA
ncbi:flavin reductase family protein [Amycolatopsis endophytica]|uniref:Flavin reductase (DIM6/NTAB) family NADH-FMN oxidoreductase RutF n=1 Tax=Amycolatopsis endophytica TaxID=860233 RepID=A0A853BCP6_9PSEU|nr:flavin reductase family protein [Amycolatopsis endophytica]NYI93178.1 flavin reductase (DIM6/NTAB) family NADH-FMN oxidoreductase RutF [Amycolatopsis endophytica]